MSCVKKVIQINNNMKPNSRKFQVHHGVFSSSAGMLATTRNNCACQTEHQRHEQCAVRDCRARAPSSTICSNSWRQMLAYAVILVCFSMCDLSSATIRNIDLYIEPPAVRHGQSVTLRCVYALKNDSLYSVKFYRGSLDFYRYMPGDKNQMIKVTHFPGINVDVNASNGTLVVLRNVSFALTGNFSCEVTCESPPFSTATARETMHVVEFPEKRPQLFTDRTRYQPGDVLRANCSTLPARPRAELRFTINNMPISTGETPQYIRTVDNLIASRHSLKLQVQAAHFTTAPSNTHMINGLKNNGDGTKSTTQRAGGNAATGSLLLRCTAQIGDLYQEYTEIELGSPQKDPVPARVTLSSSSGLRNFFDTYFSSSTAGILKRVNHRGVQVLSVACMAAMAISALNWLSLCPRS